MRVSVMVTNRMSWFPGSGGERNVVLSFTLSSFSVFAGTRMKCQNTGLKSLCQRCHNSHLFGYTLHRLLILRVT